MVTKIEIGKFENSNRDVIAQLPDEKGEYETCAGIVGLDFSKHEKLGYRYVELEISKSKELQTKKHRLKRKVNVSNEGLGQVQISRGRILYISTNAFERR